MNNNYQLKMFGVWTTEKPKYLEFESDRKEDCEDWINKTAEETAGEVIHEIEINGYENLGYEYYLQEAKDEFEIYEELAENGVL